MKTVGVIGGMGPAAAIDFQRRVLEATPAADDSEHIHLIVDNNPNIPSRIRALIDGDGEDPTPVLQAMARRLETAGAQVLAMPCNTAHHYLPAIRAAAQVPVLDMIALAANALAAAPEAPKRIGMLASPAVTIIGLYDGPLRAVGLEPIHAEGEDADHLLAIIRAIKAGARLASVTTDFDTLAGRFKDRGAEALLIACTEFSLLPKPAIGLPVVDALHVLVAETVRIGRG